MVNTTTIAWAIPVEVGRAGAGIEAYVVSKATITTFRLCVKYGKIQGAPMGRLPVEIVDDIAILLGVPFLEEMLQTWAKDIRCCEYRCKPREHFTEHELREMLRECCSPSDCKTAAEVWATSKEETRVPRKELKYLELDCRCRREELQEGYDCLDVCFKEQGDHELRHSFRVDALVRKIGQDPMRSATGRFVRCQEVFKAEFGLDIFFAISRIYDKADLFYSQRSVTRIMTHLILPSIQTNVYAEPGPNLVSYMSSLIVDPAILQPLSQQDRLRFRVALRTLCIRPYVHEFLFMSTSPTNDPTQTDLIDDEEAWLKAQIDGAKALELSGWPKLMVLTSGVCSSYQEDW